MAVILHYSVIENLVIKADVIGLEGVGYLAACIHPSSIAGVSAIWAGAPQGISNYNKVFLRHINSPLVG
jgi:hypothetical protein